MESNGKYSSGCFKASFNAFMKFYAVELDFLRDPPSVRLVWYWIYD